MEESTGDRRNFIVSAIYGLWALISAALALPGAAYLLFPPKSRREQAWIEIGSVADLRSGEPREMVFRRNRVDGWKVTSEKAAAWVVREPDSSVVAFSPQCTHLGCAYHWDGANNEFLCPCHTSTFSITGEVTGGPAPRPLDRFKVRIEDGKLLLGALQGREET